MEIYKTVFLTKYYINITFGLFRAPNPEYVMYKIRISRIIDKNETFYLRDETHCY